ncbi:DUF2971 domain-containing protein [Agrobacterium tumefaciens]|uniref:DUF2971 domain-containing protein n=1 Tax=Agrobacterium tumefaciens TaxID=358 RepID=UPI000DDA307B|nr:DUF2971 domain-containing protein [Agrobacterium tumefaciens]NTA43409.1 DUF2971 domain-containing protein [Agrobacterium tumefaciens]WIE35613.1 DUF2971 domain-containing protein [Agrobacterium tumefaciens]
MEFGLREAVTFLEQQEKQIVKSSTNHTAIRQAKKSIVDQGIPSAYACCFCSRSDSLSQWRGYTNGGQGIAIVFEVGRLEKHFADYNSVMAEVAYGQDATKKRLADEFEKLIQSRGGDLFSDGSLSADELEALILSLSPQFKHKSFEDEREWRLIVNKPKNPSDVVFRTKDNVLVPYLKLGETNVGLPIERVIVGPGKDMDITKQSIELFLRSKMEYEEVEVTKSYVPFRS